MRNNLIRAPYFASAAITTLLAIAGGCHGDRPEIVAVSGQVLVDGKPLSHGIIEFFPRKSRQSSSQLDSDGRFQLSCREPGDGAVLGTHQIAVNSGEMLPASTSTQLKIMWHAPKKYADVATSGLSENITGPRSDLTIQLSWDGGKPFVETQTTSPEREEPGHRRQK